MSTLVCVAIMVHDVALALTDASAARDQGADLVEFRVDEVFRGVGDEEETRGVLALVAGSPLPCIVTCRGVAEGGGYEGDESARMVLYERLAAVGAMPPRYLDVELTAYAGSAEVRRRVGAMVGGVDAAARPSLILSTHDFAGRPSDLMRRIGRMRDERAAGVVKIVYLARSLRDSLEVLDLPGQTGRATIALAMGEFGLMSRVLAPKFGGFLTFAALRPTTTTAPGQPTVRELLELYRFRSIRASTRVYGVVGWPVGHSMSPLVHNAGFEAVGHDGVYLPLPVAASGDAEGTYLSFKATVLEMVEHPRLDFAGCSVTLPHKENLLRLAGERGWEIDAASGALGAANTLVVERGAAGAFVSASVRNTDAPAAAACLAEALGGLEGKRVAVVGAGGVGRAVAHGAASMGATVVIYNRSAERAREVARRVGVGVLGKVTAAGMDLLPRCCCDAIVNCTPLGMSGGPGPAESAVPIARLDQCGADVVVMDTVYTPVRTPMLVAAAARGWRTVDGVGMFARQAAAQSEAWTGKAPPAALFEGLVRERLSTEAAG